MTITGIIGMDGETADCTMLMNCTASVLTDEGLQKLVISTQQSNIALNIEYAVKKWVHCIQISGRFTVPRVLQRVIQKSMWKHISLDKKKLQFALLWWFPFKMVK
jgi:hypothetical protein